MPESQAVNIRNRSFAIGALSTSRRRARGVLFAHGSLFGGHSLYIKDSRLRYAYNFVGIFEQLVVATEDVPDRTNLILSASFDKEGEDPPGVAAGTLSLYYGDRRSGRAGSRPSRGNSCSAGRVCSMGRDGGEPVTADYPGEPPYRFTGGTINRVAVDVSGEPYVDLERAAQAALMLE